jgi:predicted Rossmann-fold nucleotide-binding protein
MSSPPIEFESLAELDAHLRAGLPVAGCVFQHLDLRTRGDALHGLSLAGAAFLGCELDPVLLARAQREALVLPVPRDLPYQPYRPALYTIEGDLYAGYVPGQPDAYEHTLDARVYRHVRATGLVPASLLESLYRRLHDHGMSDALQEALEGERVVAIMGGHRLSRTSPAYRDVCRIARALARRGFLLVSGGGPGAMEATHVGVWLARRPDGDLDAALAILAGCPTYLPVGAWLDTAFAVKQQFPPVGGDACGSIGIPTWHYGHEPPNVFPTAVAKYFANSEREDGLLAVARHGVIFTPGSAGTIQEIFQDAAQNHYATSPDHASPMVFYGTTYWRETTPVYPLLDRLAAGRPYGALLAISDDVDVIVDLIARFTPPADRTGPGDAP